MNKIIKENQNGFTLIEVLIAMTVFAIGILGVAAMQLGAIKGNSYSSHLTEATTLAQDKMEELMMLDYNDSKLDPGNYTKSPGRYKIIWTIKDNVPATNTKTIDIRVTWVENGATKQVTINSVKAQM